MQKIDNIKKATQLARAIASDISIYNTEAIERSLKEDNLFTAIADELEEGRSMFHNRVSREICDNTNIRAKDRKPYAQYARRRGYEVVYEVVGEFTEEFAQMCADRNVHGVPLESILRMAGRIQLPEVEE